METIKWLVNILDKHSGAGTIILTLVLVIITVYYAIQANKQVKETRKATELNSILEAERLKEVVRVGASVIYIDLMTAIIETISISQIQDGKSYTPRNISFNKDYSVHCANLGSNLSFEEMVMVNAVYGIIEKINTEISKINYFSDPEYGSVEFSVDLLGCEVFYDEQSYRGTAKKYVYKAFDQELIINELKQGYFKLLNKLKKMATD